jgi:cytidylate kinase
MARSVVCVSGVFGSQMHEVAQAVADGLGFTVVDEEIVMRAAAEAGVDPKVVASVEGRRSFMERALETLGPTADAARFAFGGPAESLGSDAPASESLRELIRAAIEETAERGRVVIVSHAASHALASREDVLRVLVTASPETRRARLGSLTGMSEKDADRALAESDRARADYFKRFHGVKGELSTHYDLVLNTDRLAPDAAAALVVLAAGR